MKYLKHVTVAGEDEKIQALRSQHGLAAYGAYWLILEKIATQFRAESISTSLTLSVRKWGQHVEMKPTWIRKVLMSGHSLGLWSAVTNGELITINVPNLLKYCDEYTKKVRRVSGQTPEAVRSGPGLPALPALLPIQDLAAGATAGGLEAPAVPPKATRSKDACAFSGGCPRRGTIPGNDGKWYCDLHDREPTQPPPPPPPGNGAGKEENKTTVPQIIRALNLTPEKSASVAPLFHRHQERPFPNDELASQLLGAGLDANEVFRAARVFFRKQ
jgi:hypothetical protein